MKKYCILSLVIFAPYLSLLAQTNFGFESWTTVPASFPAPSYTTPNNWNSLNGLTSALGVITCVKATAAADVHSGSNAVQLITKSVNSQIANGLLTTGTINQASSSVGGGTDYTLRPDSIIGWYKCSPKGGDSGFIQALLLGAGGDTDTIAYGIFRTPTTDVTNYTRFAQEIIYRSENQVVKSILMLSSSYDNNLHVVNSTLYVDDFQLGSDAWEATDIEEVENSQFTVGPNPASLQVIVYNPNFIKCRFQLYDGLGTQMKNQKMNGPKTVIAVDSFSNGIYFYSITDENEFTIKTGKLIIQN